MEDGSRIPMSGSHYTRGPLVQLGPRLSSGTSPPKLATGNSIIYRRKYFEESFEYSYTVYSIYCVGIMEYRSENSRSLRFGVGLQHKYSLHLIRHQRKGVQVAIGKNNVCIFCQLYLIYPLIHRSDLAEDVQELDHGKDGQRIQLKIENIHLKKRRSNQ